MLFPTLFWQKAPALRVFFAFTAGILLQWYLRPPMPVWILIASLSLLFLVLYEWSGVLGKWRLGALAPLCALLLITALGGSLTQLRDPRVQPGWFGREPEAEALQLLIAEPLVEKERSYKAVCEVEAVYVDGAMHASTGKLILYLRKDSVPPPLKYGSRVLLGAQTQPIRNSGNPGAFDYERYALFSGITHQVFADRESIQVLPVAGGSPMWHRIFEIRDSTVAILRRYIPSAKEAGLAEALLIGYKDDLDKPLVEAYAQTGTVHIIAISGLHLGMISVLMLWITRRLGRGRHRWLQLVIVLFFIWGFTLIAGAQPSVLRAAIMFSIVYIGKILAQRVSSYNTLALSALALLCMNPYWLWDLGFQLSYAAVLSIMVFYRPILSWLPTGNWVSKKVSELVSVSLAAQILTLPISIYHFHQFPSFFLLANLLAVPLSGIILYGEILLVCVSPLDSVATWVGIALKWLIWCMNSLVEWMATLPGSVWEGLSINTVQCLLLYAAIWGAGLLWLLRQKRGLWVTGVAVLLFLGLRMHSFWTASRQEKLIVYNVPKLPAMDLIKGRQYWFVGDPTLLPKGYLRNFHLAPSRTLHRASPQQASFLQGALLLGNRRVLMLDTGVTVAAGTPPSDVLILSHNPRMDPVRLLSHWRPRQVVMDGSLRRWRAAHWQRVCDSLKIPCHNVQEKGAFVLNLKSALPL